MNYPSMSRRHFQFIADTIKFAYFETEAERERIAKEFAGRLSSTNGAFKRERFLDACRREVKS